MTADRSLVSTGDLMDLLDRAHTLVQHDHRPPASSWRRDYYHLVQGLQGNFGMLRSRVAELVADAVNTPHRDISERNRLEEEFTHFLREYMDSLPLVRPIELIPIDPRGNPGETLAMVIYELSLRAGIDLTEESWAEASEDTKAILREVSSQLVTAGLISRELPGLLASQLSQPEPEFATGGYVAKPSHGEDQVPFTHIPGGLPPNIGMPTGFISDSQRATGVTQHHPGTDPVSHPNTECAERGCYDKANSDEGAGGSS